MTHNDSIMNHCPHCDSLCLSSQNEIDKAQAANKAVAITCHQCKGQFGLDHNCPTDTKRARPAEMKIVDCPSCKMAITVPKHLSGDVKVGLFCPLCDSEIQQADLDNQAAATPTAPAETPSPVAEISNNNASKARPRHERKPDAALFADSGLSWGLSLLGTRNRPVTH